MRLFVACEFSQVVCIEFRKLGHEAFSCDLLPCEGGHPEWHIQDDCLKHLNDGWDLMIAHPPCTYLSIAGYHYSIKDSRRMKKTFEALEFFKVLYNSPIRKVCIENPVSMVSSLWRKADQIVNPFNFGVGERKSTHLWLKNLAPLKTAMPVTVSPKGFIIRKSGPNAGQKYNYYWRQGKNAHDRSHLSVLPKPWQNNGEVN